MAIHAPTGSQYRCGLKLRALDLAKFGQLYKNGGSWNNKSLLPKDWVNKSLSPQIDLPENRGHYGYLFWNTAYTVHGKPYQAYFSSGNGGNKVFIFKDLPLVIVVTATAYNKPYAHPQVDNLMQQYILPALVVANH